MLKPRKTLREVVEVVVEVVEAVVDMERELVAEMGNVLLGMMIMQRKAPTLVL